MQAAENKGKKHWFIKYRFDPVEDHYIFKQGKEVLLKFQMNLFSYFLYFSF